MRTSERDLEHDNKAKMKSIVILLAIVCHVTIAKGTDEPTLEKLLFTDWTSYKVLFNKSYDDEWEEAMRSKIFETNLKYIVQFNEQYAKGEKSYYLGINEFTDMTHQEFLSFYTSPMDLQGAMNGSLFLPPLNMEAPRKMDWRTKGYVTPVKNQGRCGSCWAFSSTGSLEGQHYRKTRRLIPLSEQQLVDCSRTYGNHACQGGLMPYAFNYIKAVGGIQSESTYPYTGREGTCSFQKSKAVARDTGYVSISKGSESALLTAVASVGPISVAIDASRPSFQHYRGGVYNDPSCTTTKLNHAVLVVGYDSSTSGYWQVKNSWGKSWGESGYIRMSRNRRNQCGIASYASYPQV